MANAYATFAADGVYCEPLPVLRITDATGREFDAATAPDCHQAVRRQVARGVIDAARCVTGYGAAAGPCGGWSTAPGVHGMVGRPVAGKTGTTDDTRAAWFVGMTPGLAAASFIADPDNPFHVAGDWNSHKPVETVAFLLRDGLRGTPVRWFTPPSVQTAYGSAWGARGWGRGQFGQSPWDRLQAEKRKQDRREDARRPPPGPRGGRR
jgi:membrane peptidoglycan carboxypeptidase